MLIEKLGRHCWLAFALLAAAGDREERGGGGGGEKGPSNCSFAIPGFDSSQEIICCWDVRPCTVERSLHGWVLLPYGAKAMEKAKEGPGTTTLRYMSVMQPV